MFPYGLPSAFLWVFHRFACCFLRFFYDFPGGFLIVFLRVPYGFPSVSIVFMLFHGAPMVFPMDFPILFLGLPLVSHVFPMVFHRFSYYFLILCFAYCFPGGFPWVSLLFPIRFLKGVHWVSFYLLWFSSGFPYGVPMGFHGFPIVFHLVSPVFPPCFSVGFPLDSWCLSFCFFFFFFLNIFRPK